jgi:vacuolar-type H+-ATPase subunit E/Vma4
VTEHESGTGTVVTAASGLLSDLNPVTGFLADAARRRGEEIVDDADAQADRTLAEAQQQADAILAAARESGAAVARISARAVLADARREARQEVLCAQRLIYEQVRARLLERLRFVAHSPEAATLNVRLGNIARQRLGADATVTTPEGEIGVVAHCGARSLDLSTEALAERAMASSGEEIGGLWS